MNALSDKFNVKEMDVHMTLSRLIHCRTILITAVMVYQIITCLMTMKVTSLNHVKIMKSCVINVSLILRLDIYWFIQITLFIKPRCSKIKFHFYIRTLSFLIWINWKIRSSVALSKKKVTFLMCVLHHTEVCRLMVAI